MSKRWLISSIILNILLIIGIGLYLINRNERNIIYSQKEAAFNNFGNYYKTKRSIFNIMPDDSTAIIFLGDSHINNNNWSELINKSNIKNRGIGGENLPGLLNRIDDVIEEKPIKIFIMIGINDLAQGYSVSTILSNYKKLLTIFQQRSPGSKVYIHSLLPVLNFNNVDKKEVIEVNQGLLTLSNKLNITFINLYDNYVDDSNNLKSVYTYDGLHLNGQGYLNWVKIIKPYLQD